MDVQELRKRKVEFLEKWKELMSEYNVVMGINMEGTFYIVTDGHEGQSWNDETIINDLTEECIDDALNVLN